MPVAGERHRVLDDRRDPLTVDVLHRENVHVRVADRHFLARVEIADADDHGVRRLHLRRDLPMRDNSAGSLPRSAASGIPWTLPDSGLPGC